LRTVRFKIQDSDAIDINALSTITKRNSIQLPLVNAWPIPELTGCMR